MPTARNTASAKASADTKKKTVATKKTVVKTETAKAAPITRSTAKAAPTTRSAASAQIKPTAAKKADGGNSPRIAPEQRHKYVEVAAYFIAERRGFTEGYQTGDWFAAEAEIDRLIQENKLSA